MSTFKASFLSLLLSSTLLAGCQSTPNSNANDMGMKIPDWILNPTVEKGLAASSCVTASNSFSMDKSQVATQARAELTKQIETRVSSLQEEYSTKLASMGETNTESKTINTTAQFTNQFLRGSKIVKVDYADINKVRNLCALAILPEKETKNLFSQLIKSAPTALNPENEALLYLNFMKSENNK